MDYRVIQILDSVLGPGRSFAKGEQYHYCPFCHHKNPKLAVNVTKGMWQCWKCGARGRKILNLLRRLDVPRAMIQELATLLQDEVPELQTDSVVARFTLPDEFIPLTSPPDTNHARWALRYLHERGVTDIDILRYNIGFCPTGRYFNRIIVPSYTESGELNYFVARDFSGRAPLSYANPPVSKNVIGLESQINWHEPIVLVEGIFDAMAVRRNAIPLLGKTLPAKLKKKIIHAGVRDIYVALDNDALKETIRIAEYYLKEGVNVWLVSLNGKDPAVLGMPAMRELIKSATKLDFMSLVQLKMKL